MNAEEYNPDFSRHNVVKVEEHIGELLDNVPDEVGQPHIKDQESPSLSSGRLHLPEREVHRRLWRVYEMALDAANRVEQ